uniref:tyrosine--tRNA ligase n=1 Tax=Steinernema glaseri TaxID=37863 RepID=A0A1I7ZWK1_9BILA
MGDDMETDYVNEAEKKLGFPEQAARLCEGLGYRPFASLLVPSLLGMNEVKMGSVDAENHLEPFDTKKETKKKISKSFCEAGNLRGGNGSERNVALHLSQVLLFPHFLAEKGLAINRTPENGGDLDVRTFEELENLFAAEKLHPADLKTAVTREINAIFDPVREELAATQAKMIKEAFPVKKGGKKK